MSAHCAERVVRERRPLPTLYGLVPQLPLGPPWRRNLSVSWVDYQKVYNRTPHPWIREILKVIRAPKLVRRCMGMWSLTGARNWRYRSERTASGGLECSSNEDCIRIPCSLCCFASGQQQLGDSSTVVLSGSGQMG